MRDVIVVGAGFAGLATARELAVAGIDVGIVEARDRIGGRTWTDTWDGIQIERGGGWVHWSQPHTWSELTRAGLGLSESASADRISWRVRGELRTGTLEHAHGRLITDAWNRFVEDAEAALPRPHDPLFARERALAHDAVSCAERLAALGLDEDSEALLHAELIGLVHGPIADASALEPMRWHALPGYSLANTEASGGSFGIAAGMGGLARAMLAQAGCDIAYETPVVEVRRHADRAEVVTAAGDVLEARVVVVTSPLNALRGIRFTPGLPAEADAWVQRGQASQGMKLWIRARSDGRMTLALDPTSPLSFVMPDRVLPDGSQLLIAFTERSTTIRPDDLDWVQRELDLIAPGYAVEATTSHDWWSDPWARGTWAVHRPGWWASGHEALNAPHGPLILANSDLARGWAGFVDGALESGISAARRARALLAGR